MTKVKTKIKRALTNSLEWIILLAVALLCVVFLQVSVPAEDGSRTLDGSNAKIEDYTKDFIEDANAALDRIMNEDAPTDEETIRANDGEEVGLGFYVDIDTILSRRLPDGDNDGGKGWQCSKYTAYLATGKKEYSAAHPDYGPVNGKDVASYLVKNYGFKYIDKPVAGAIGSGGMNTTYGHTVMYLYSTGTNTAMVNDANYTPLTVSTHNMNISGYVWVVPGNYSPTKPSDDPQGPSDTKGDITYVVNPGDTLGGVLVANGYSGNKLFGDDGAAQSVANTNNILNRGLIYPGQTIKIKQEQLK